MIWSSLSFTCTVDSVFVAAYELIPDQFSSLFLCFSGPGPRGEYMYKTFHSLALIPINGTYVADEHEYSANVPVYMQLIKEHSLPL